MLERRDIHDSGRPERPRVIVEGRGDAAGPDAAGGAAHPGAPERPSARERVSAHLEHRRQESRRPDAILAAAEGDERRTRKINVAFRLYGVLALLSGINTLVFMVLGILTAIASIRSGQAGELLPDNSAAITVITVVSAVLSALLALMYARLGWKLLHNNRHYAGSLAYTMIVLVVGNLLCDIMLGGLSLQLIPTLVNLVMLILISSFVDPSLIQERQLRRKLRNMEYREEADAGGRDETGRGYVSLNFFNLFWTFVLASIVGLVVEDVYRLVTVGVLESRAGLLYGPFSPIYGFGAVLLTVALNRLWRKPAPLVFVMSAVIGATFEYLVSWFMQFAFGITAWDYSGPWLNPDGTVNLISFMNVDGRTSLLFALFWGALGLAWIKLILPYTLRLINLIPWDWRYVLTTVGFVAMLADGALTLISLDCWYERATGVPPKQPLEQFCATYYGDDFMRQRFQTMTIDPGEATRTARVS